MKAVRFDISVPRFLLVRGLGNLFDAVVLSGLEIAEVPAPALPGPEWVAFDVIGCGICGSDLGVLWFQYSVSLEPFSSYPAVLGHEILGRVSEVGAAVSGLEPGERIAIDPFISCRARGHEVPCRSCVAGGHATCERSGEPGPLRIDGEPFAPGSIQGYHRQVHGGWSERSVCHAAHAFAVPDDVPDRSAVLTEPLSIAMHAVLGAPPEGDGPVLVIGSGAIAMGVIWALRATGFQGTVVAQAKRPHEQDLARALGATEVVRPGDEAREALLATGARAYSPSLGPEVYAGGGYPLIFDCVGKAGSIAQSLAWASPRARIAVLGCAASIPKLDLSNLWARELKVLGFVGYGIEADGRHTHEHTLQALRGDKTVQRLVTHTFRLDQARDAVRAAANHRTSGAMKVVLTPTGEPLDHERSLRASQPV